MPENIPPRLSEIIEEFQFCEGREKLELLVQYSQNLPPLPGWLAGQRDRMESIPECMTPVWVESEMVDGKLIFHFDVPAESPMVRGFASVMKQGLDGSSAEEVLQTPADFYHALGLDTLLTNQRLNGFSSILAHMKHLAVLSLDVKEDV